MRALLVAGLLLGGGCQTSPVGPTCGDGLECGSARMPVMQADGTVDEVYVYGVVPTDATDLGVVVYAHGQGLGGVSNCEPDASRYSTPNARVLAAQGFAAVAVHYRNAGDGAPGRGALRMRDHHLRDARTLLAAARFLRDQFPDRVSDRVALVGSSMGTWPALWAVSGHPDLADLQDTLDLRTTIVHGETGNHLANGSRRCALQGSASGDDRITALIGTAYGALRTETTRLGLSEITSDDLDVGQPLGDAVRVAVTDRGVDALRAVFFDPPDPTIAGCADLADMPAECGADCAYRTMRAQFGAEPILTDFVTQEALDAYCVFLDEPDPGPDTGNALLTGLREQSPAYVMEGPMRVTRALSLLSEGDGHYNPPAQALLLERLASLGVDAPSPAPNPGPDCEHEDYEDPSRAECGLDLIAAELRAALSP